jgi:hypothetical protein
MDLSSGCCGLRLNSLRWLRWIPMLQSTSSSFLLLDKCEESKGPGNFKLKVGTALWIPTLGYLFLSGGFLSIID